MLQPPSGVCPPAPCPSSGLLPRGSGREGGVSGVGGREPYKSAGGAPAQASLTASRRDRDRRTKHWQWSGRCARAQCVDYLQPLLMQYAGVPEQLNGVATPLLGLPWKRKWQPTPVFLPGAFHGQRSLVGSSPWGCKELDAQTPLLGKCRRGQGALIQPTVETRGTEEPLIG